MKDSLEETLVLSDKYGFVVTPSSFKIDNMQRIIRDVVGQIIAFSGVLYSASEAVMTFPFKSQVSQPQFRLQPLTCYGLLLMSPSVRCPNHCTCLSLTKPSLVRSYGIGCRLFCKKKKCQQIFSLVRPEFTDTLAIKSGRHPVLETVQSAGMVVSNDIYCSDAAHFHIVQGPKCVS